MTKEYEIEWQLGNQWGVVYVNAASEAVAHRRAKAQLNLSCTAGRFVKLLTL